MKIDHCKQMSQEWYMLKKGKIGGTRLGQVMSNRKNRLIYDLLSERLNEHPEPPDYINWEMQFGIDNEDIAAEMYAKQSGIEFQKVGAILSDFSDIHLASPDRVNLERGIVLEVKCTPHGSKQIQRYFEGVDPEYLPQITNYFAVSDEIKEVHWVSYCPYRPEKPLIVFVFTRDDWEWEQGHQHIMFATITEAREKVRAIEEKLNQLEQQFIF